MENSRPNMENSLKKTVYKKKKSFFYKNEKEKYAEGYVFTSNVTLDIIAKYV